MEVGRSQLQAYLGYRGKKTSQENTLLQEIILTLPLFLPPPPFHLPSPLLFQLHCFSRPPPPFPLPFLLEDHVIPLFLGELGLYWFLEMMMFFWISLKLEKSQGYKSKKKGKCFTVSHYFLPFNGISN